jgi:steroid 5-alpha reductase family enzyme
MGEGIGILLVLVIFGIICSAIASAKGRSPVLWFIWGFLFTAIAVLLIANLPKQEKII